MPTINGTPGPDNLVDTAAADVVSGFEGDDSLTTTGTGGSIVAEVYDLMDGAGGNDTLIVNHGHPEIAVVNIGYFNALNPFTGGRDGRMWGGYGYVDYRSIENFIIYAGMQGDEIETFNGNDIVYGGDGNNVIRTGAGNDLIYSGIGMVDLAGGAGNDIYYVADYGGAIRATSGGITELINEGFDIIYAINSYTVASDAYVEALAFAYADDTRSLSLIGNHLAQQMVGNAGNNVIDGGLNSAPDVMYGLAGDDTFIVSPGSVVIEAAGEGFDTVITSGTPYQLPADVHVEVLRAADPLALGGAVLVGNAVAQTLYGDASANHLNGLGGGDVMVGYAGNDTYIVNDVRDGIVEAAGQGTADTVFAAVSYQLSAGAAVERLQSQQASSSTLPLNFTGNEFAQTIYGNAGNNVLNGNGGGDILQGLGGNDYYIVNNASDGIVESDTNADFDAVFTTVSYALQLSIRIETLSTLFHSGTDPIILVGSDFGQNIIGNAGPNRIAGQGGPDTILGLGGADTFNFSYTGASVDTLLDFESGSDKIELEHLLYTGLAVGPLAAGAFVVGTQALDADDRIIFNPVTGALYYDGNGSAGGAQLQFATIPVGLPLAYTDIYVI